MIQVKRIYEPPAELDGKRVLVERLWPRGMSKEKARVDLWLKDIAPSVQLRQWFAHDPAKWAEFRARYQTELEQAPQAVAQLRQLLEQHTVTLVYATRDEQHNSTVVLKEFLEQTP